ncbi:MAG: DUF3301 domain-containing protein [Arenimonas sp.]|jgi:hypothetical protein
MSLPTILLLCIIPAFAFWISGRAAAEKAALHSRQACQHAGVQWLDQSVHQVRLRLKRNGAGRLCWERQYRFEYSSGGDDRHAGLVTMLGGAMSGLVGPMPQTIQTIN